METILGYDINNLATDIEKLEPELAAGKALQIEICTEGTPTQEDLAQIVINADQAGFAATFPTFKVISGIPTTSFVLTSGHLATGGNGLPTGQWQLILPIIIPLATIGVIVYGITKIGSITSALFPIILTVGGIVIVTVALLRKPAQTYIEKGGKFLPETIALENLPATKAKSPEYIYATDQF